MTEEAKKRRYGNLSVLDVANFNNRSLMSDDGVGIKGYHFNPELRFGFNRNHKVQQQKMRRVFDVIAQKEKKLPAPTSYSSSAHRKDFNDISKKSRIFTHERKSAIQIIAADKKWVPGIGRYDVTTYDEKRDKPAKGIYKTKDQRITFHDEALLRGK